MSEILDMPAPSPTIAIVGSGPAGCYLGSFLRRRWADAEIVIFDRLAMPYGLARFGVAPDHLGTRAVTRQFDRLFNRSGVRFIGGVEIGKHVSLDDLRAAFDIVVLATGLSTDRKLGVSGDSLPGLHGSGRITRLINNHPDEQVDGLDLGERVTIVGNGNVAVDLVRLFLTTPGQLRDLGVAQDVLDAIGAGPVRHIDVVGRSRVGQAKFDLAMVRELAQLPEVRFIAEGLPDEVESRDLDEGAKLLAVRALVEGSERNAERAVQFHFGWAPERVLGDDAVQGITFRPTTGERSETMTLDADAVITAIGFTEAADASLRRCDYECPTSQMQHGYLAPGLYCAGWLRRGPQGTIPVNRADSKIVADAIWRAVDGGTLAVGKPGSVALPHLDHTTTDTHTLEVSA